VLLLVLASLPSANADSGAPSIGFNEDQGVVFEDTSFSITGTSTVALNDVTWDVVDISSEVVLTSGSFLDNVAPDGDGAWTWAHNVTVPEPGCTCRFVVHHAAVSEALVIYVGSPVTWSPVWLDEPEGRVLLNNEANTTVALDVVFPPQRGNGSVVEIQRCPASASQVCKTPISTVSLPLQYDGVTSTVVFEPSSWSPEGHWAISSMSVVDVVLSRSTAVAWQVLHDATPPSVSIEASDRATESDPVIIVVNATDVTSEEVVVVDVRATDPTGVVQLLGGQTITTGFLLHPHLAGDWEVSVTAEDGAGLTTTVSHAVTVSNLPPEANVRLNGAVVESGDELSVRAGDPFLLDGSASKDTGNDLLNLNHVWWINSDGRISGVETLMNDRFSEAGVYEVRLEVVDDDGASDELTFTLEVIDEDEPLREAAVLGPLLLVLVGLGLAVLMFVRNRAKAPSIPTWPGDQDS
jgi:hypothetical protein